MKKQEFLKKFKDYLLLNGKTLSTTTTYLSHVKSFIDYLNINNIQLSTITTTPTTTLEGVVGRYILDRGSRCSIKTTNNDTMVVDWLLKYFNLEIKTPKLRRAIQKLPEHIDLTFLEEEVIPLIDEDTFRNPEKAIAVLYLLFFTGIRQSELICLRRENFDFEKRTLKIFEVKKKRERMVFFNQKVSEAVQRYFGTEEEEQNAFNLGSQGVSYIFRKLREVGRFEINLHPHLLRHSFSIYVLEQGIDLATLSELLGHENIATTMIYAKKTNTKLKEIYDKHIK